MMNDRRTLGLLQTLGLTTYDAKAYATLTRTGSLTPFALAEEAGIPRTKIYETIKRLEKENWVTVEKGRPGKISPVCPSDAIGSRKAVLDTEIETMANEFTMNFEKRMETETPKTSTIKGLPNIAVKTADMMQRARTSLYLFGTLYYPEELEPIKQQLAAAKRRGVILRISANNPVRTKEQILDVIESFSRVTKDIQTAPEPFIRTLTIDSREMLMMLPLPETELENRDDVIALWVANDRVTKAINNLFNIMWGNPNWTGSSE
jgi:HTH-type transcriptional regulator, sugar sensing transcriptional regulator